MCTMIHTSLRVHFLVIVIVMTSSPWFGADALKSSAPKFKQDIVPNKHAFVDGSSKFVCRTKGNPRPFISWYHNGEVISSSQRIKIKKYSLQVFQLKVSDRGKYACKVENGYGVVWGNFTLKVSEIEAPPRFQEGITRVSYIVRADTSEVDLDCSARSYTGAIITWWKNGNIQIQEEEGKYIMDEFKLKILSLTLDDRGDYSCIVGNKHGNISHKIKVEVHLRVALAPMMEDVKNQTAFVGENVTFTCQIIYSDSQPLLQWIRHFKVNGSFMNEKQEPYVKIRQQTGYLRTIDDPQELVLYNVSKEDEGWYTCLVANTVGLNYRSAWLEVKPPLSFIEGVNKITYITRADTLAVELDCSARAYPSAAITWWRNGNTQIHETNDKYLMVEFKLMILSLISEDKGEYSCVVSNKYGNISQTITVEVRESGISIAAFMEDMKNQTAVKGGNATFTCRVLMTWSNSLVYWVKHDSNRSEKGRPSMILLEHSGYLRTIDDPQELVLYNVSKEDEGWYTCFVANEDGMRYRSAWLEVLDETETEDLRQT